MRFIRLMTVAFAAAVLSIAHACGGKSEGSSGAGGSGGGVEGGGGSGAGVSIETVDVCAKSGASLFAKAAYQELLVFPGGCPPDPDLAGGKTTGAVVDETAPASAALPAIGELPKGEYGFALVLRNDQCAVIAYGCTDADLGSVSKIEIVPCGSWDSNGACVCAPLAGGGCAPPATCQMGKCVQGSVGDAGGCTLAVERAGLLPALGAPPAETAQLSGPGLAATDDGFVLAYRDQIGDALRLLIAALPDAADLGSPSIFDLGGCSSKGVTDGIGVAFEGGKGMVASSQPNCGKGAGAVIVSFDGAGVVGTVWEPTNPSFFDLAVAQTSSLAPAAQVGDYEFLYWVDSGSTKVVERVVLQGLTFKAGVPVTHPFGEVDMPPGMVATTPQIRAMLGAPGLQPVIKISDRSNDTIVEKGSVALAPDGPPQSLIAWDNHVAAATNHQPGSSVIVATLANDQVLTDASGVVGSANVESTRLAVLRSHMFVAQGHAGGITLHRLEGADSKIDLKPAQTIELPTAMGPANLTSFDGSRFAVAAARSHVAVVWLSQATLAAGEPTGGWALLSCPE